MVSYQGRSEPVIPDLSDILEGSQSKKQDCFFAYKINCLMRLHGGTSRYKIEAAGHFGLIRDALA